MRIYEINTWIWLAELSESYGHALTLESIPDVEWDRLVPYHFDAVWLMGVWQRSPEARVIARSDAGVRSRCREVLPGLGSADIVASPYAVHSYVVDERFGGPTGLAAARAQLAKRHLKLVLDFVPNHTAPDHLWTLLHPEYYVRGSSSDLQTEPDRFFLADGETVLARGAVARRGDPIWSDTAQLDAFSPGYREAATLTVLDIASQCDGVRCDMAMLLCSANFAANWGSSRVPAVEFWEHVIGDVRRRHPLFLFIAESYSDSEWALQQQGFDYCYDKDRLYERLAHGDAESVRLHLQCSAPGFLARLLHFIENHDEASVMQAFRPSGRHQAAAVAIATLPGASLWYDQQFAGRWGQLPVQLGRSLSVRTFYQRILAASAHSVIRKGTWSFCSVVPREALLAWCWSLGEQLVLVVINFSDREAWGKVALDLPRPSAAEYALVDLFSGENYGMRDGTEMTERGLNVGLPAWGFHLFELTPVSCL